MKIMIIGSTSYQQRIQEHKEKLESAGHEVQLPVFDTINGDEYNICFINRDFIVGADEVHVIWDARSIGTIFDLGVCFGLNKPIKLIYLNKKQFVNFVTLYDKVSSLEVPDDQVLYTCYKCTVNRICKWAWDKYNTNGECLAEK